MGRDHTRPRLHVIALLTFASAADTLLNENLGCAGWMVGLISLASGAVGVCFWLGLPFARLALCFVPLGV